MSSDAAKHPRVQCLTPSAREMYLDLSRTVSHDWTGVAEIPVGRIYRLDLCHRPALNELIRYGLLMETHRGQWFLIHPATAAEWAEDSYGTTKPEGRRG